MTTPALEHQSFAPAQATEILDRFHHKSQCGHRGAPNQSQRVRYLLQHSMGRRWVAQRFYPFLNYHMPEQVLEGADERLLRVLGKHYG